MSLSETAEKGPMEEVLEHDGKDKPHVDDTPLCLFGFLEGNNYWSPTK